MKTSYDKLKQIEFYKTHPEYLPFIGDHYDQFRILQVGESHYIGQTPKTEEFPISYFADNWWKDKCLPVYSHTHPGDVDWGSWYTTQHVIARFFADYQKNYSIFSQPLHIFRQACPQVPLTGERQDYHYFAFMNFFQMPALYDGVSFKRSLRISAKKLDKPQLADEVFQVAAKNSADVLDDVIKTIDPAVVIFTSTAAWKAYKKHSTLAASEGRPVMIRTVHPGCCWWNRRIKDFGNTGRGHLEAELKKALSSDAHSSTKFIAEH